MAVENHERRFLVQGHPYWLALALVDLGLKQPTERESEGVWSSKSPEIGGSD